MCRFSQSFQLFSSPRVIYKESLLITGNRFLRTDGTARFVKEAPDTITSWVITAFSLDTFHGLGVIEQPAKVNKRPSPNNQRELLITRVILLRFWVNSLFLQDSVSFHSSFENVSKSDAAGSTWLTAFVARSFRQAQPYITIEDHVIEDSLKWLSANQAPNGSFPEVGKVSHTDMQGGAGKGVPLTAYVLLAFLENKAGLRYGPTMQKAADFLVKELPSITDPYALSLVTYALHLAEVEERDVAFDMLQAKANTTEEEFRFWSKPKSEKDKSNPWSSLTTSVDVEMTAYALLTFLQRGLVIEALPIMKWMVANRNSNGGFSSTQDTVIGLYALAKLAEKITVPNTNINVKIKHDAGAETFSLSRENAMVLQKFKVKPLQLLYRF